MGIQAPTLVAILGGLNLLGVGAVVYLWRARAGRRERTAAGAAGAIALREGRGVETEALSDPIEELLHGVELDELTMRRKRASETRLAEEIARWRTQSAGGTNRPVPAGIGRGGARRDVGSR